jgi:hypothetical protein
MSSVLAKHAAPVSIFSWAFLAIGLALFGLAGVGWSDHLSDDGELVANNVRFAGSPVEGLTQPEVAAEVAARSEGLLEAELKIVYGRGELTMPYRDLGFGYDEAATTSNVMTARHEGSAWDQFAAWAIGELIPKEATEVWSFDPERARSALDDHPGLTPLVVEEPQIAPDGAGALVAVPGVEGIEADIDDIVAQLARIELTAAPDTLTTGVEEIHPSVTDEDAVAETERLNQLTGDGVRFTVEGREAFLTGRTLQRHLRIELEGGDIEARFDGTGLQQALENTIVGPIGQVVEPTFRVENGEVEIVAPGEVPPVCCRPGVGEWLGDQVLAGEPGPFRLDPRPADDPETIAWARGTAIVEQVSEFTTPHACCESRVENIHRIADMVRGVYLIPGERFSLNEFVGPRTVENGFVAAGAIRQGHLIQEVGGGVSQFATTIFNAAYFAGMDFVEYRSHTIYFSRYPYGREATISNPAPDLVFVNNTAYPILIWTSYTEESITVSMYSTKNVTVDELDQRTSRYGVCTHVETDRERTFADGRKVVDTIVADYRPAEGIDCNGDRIPPPAV